MLYSDAQIESCPLKLHRFKILVSTDKHLRHHTRPLVSVAAVGGIGGRKTFEQAGRHHDSPAIG